MRRRVENIAAAQPGSMEEALLYTQTYGDVWTDAAKKFLEDVLDSRARAKKSAEPANEEAARGRVRRRLLLGCLYLGQPVHDLLLALVELRRLFFQRLLVAVE